MKQEGSLAHGKRLLGMRFCRLVIYAHLHNFLMFVHLFCTFLVTFGITVQKKEVWNMAKHGLEDVSVVWLFMLTLYVHQNGSDGVFHLFCECWVSSWENTLRTWQTVFRKVFLLFGDLSKSSRLPCMCVKIVPKGVSFLM